jgi:diacylglycerol kinase
MNKKKLVTVLLILVLVFSLSSILLNSALETKIDLSETENEEIPNKGKLTLDILPSDGDSST